MLSNSRQEAGTSVHCLFSPFFFKTEVFSLSLGWEDPLEKEMAACSSTIAWKIPWTEEPGRLHAVHGVAKSKTDFTFNFHFHTLEKEMATHSNIFAWRIPWIEESVLLQLMGLQRIRQD